MKHPGSPNLKVRTTFKHAGSINFGIETAEKIKKIAATAVGYARKQEKNTVNEEKNCVRTHAIHVQNRNRTEKLTLQ
jgi:hypothetical protein